jgi:hypothetical protein
MSRSWTLPQSSVSLVNSKVITYIVFIPRIVSLCTHSINNNQPTILYTRIMYFTVNLLYIFRSNYHPQGSHTNVVKRYCNKIAKWNRTLTSTYWQDQKICGVIPPLINTPYNPELRYIYAASDSADLSWLSGSTVSQYSNNSNNKLKIKNVVIDTVCADHDIRQLYLPLRENTALTPRMNNAHLRLWCPTKPDNFTVQSEKY